MSYCRYCGKEISYKRTKNDKWIPCNAMTGEPHFCQDTEKKTSVIGIGPCPECGKPVFRQKKGRGSVLYDYTTLMEHKCRASDITRFKKFKEKQ